MDSFFTVDSTENGKNILYEQACQLKNVQFIDLRSPTEFAEAHIPTAMNIPIFSDEERSIVGTIYKQVGEKDARWKAMEIVSPKLQTLLAQLKQLSELGKQPIVYCWRGGMRSKSITYFAELSGLEIQRLTGGYRAYRQFILEMTPKLLPKQAVVLHGMTGTGKTAILLELARHGLPVIDLEAAAHHRGSLFGSIGMEDPYNQKTFDSLLFEQVKQISGQSFFLMEGESKRIGKSVMPDYLLSHKEQGIHLFIDCTDENRITRIYNEYVVPFQKQPWFHENVEIIMKQIIKRIKNQAIAKELTRAVNEKTYEKLIRLLIHIYYDPRYDYKENQYHEKSKQIDGNDTKKAAKEIISYLESIGFQIGTLVSR